MRKPSTMLLSSFFLVVAGMAALTLVHAARNAEDQAGAQQSTEDMRAQGQYKIAKKEAEAAYREALTNRKKMRKAERTACMQGPNLSIRSRSCQERVKQRPVMFASANASEDCSVTFGPPAF